MLSLYAAISNQLNLERDGKPHRILHDFLDLFSNTRDCRGLIWACEPYPVVEEQDHLYGETRFLKGTMKTEHCDLEHIRFQHLYHGILRLPFLPIRQFEPTLVFRFTSRKSAARSEIYFNSVELV
jgi:hypothetical protein